MNNNPAGGAAPGNAGQANQQGQAIDPYRNLIRPGQVQNLMFIDPATRLKYQNGIQGLWQTVSNNPRESANHQQALQKLRQFSAEMMTKMRQHNQSQAQAAGQQSGQPQQSNARPASQGQAQQANQGAQASQQASQMNPQAQQMQAVAQAQAQAQRAQNLSQPQTQQQQAQQTQPNAQTVQQARPQQNGQAAAAQTTEVPPQYLKQAESFQIKVPESMSEADGERFVSEIRKRFAKGLYTRDSSMQSLRKLEQYEAAQKALGKELTPELVGRKGQFQASLSGAKGFLENLIKQHANTPAAAGAATAGLNAQAAQQANRPQPAQNASQSGTAGASMSTAGGPAGAAAANNAQSGAANVQPNAQQRPQMAQGQPSFGGAGARPPMPNQPNGAMMQGRNQSPQTGLPTPGGGGQQQPAAPVSSLNLATAMQQARNTQNTQAPPPASAQPQREPERQPKQNFNAQPMRNWTPPAPQPVHMAAARPTLGGAGSGLPGMLGQPAIAQKPEYSLHGDGDRVLDKKKLDELVRQVAGAGDGGEFQGLQPDVEESVLQLADEFVDTVVTAACRLAKARGSNSLELRDIQIVLERHYNIRIPGYALDDNRTVRKVQPSPGYLQKMNAIQAAKVMGGKTDL